MREQGKAFPRFGISKITDMMLMNEVNVSVNVGMGASNPNDRFQKFMTATSAAIQLTTTAPPGANIQEMIKELYSNAGYRDGARFWSEQQDPRLLKAMQTIQQMQGLLEGKQMEIQAGLQETQMKLMSNEKIKGAELQVDQGRIQGDLAIRQSETAIEAARVELEKFIAQMEAQGAEQEMMAAWQEQLAKLKQAEIQIQGLRIKNEGAYIKMIGEIKKQEMQSAAQ